jgi:hypothetical protein
MFNLFYEEPDNDRWLPFDRFPRKLLRRLLRGPRCVWGQQRVFLNLCAGLDKLSVDYRINDYKYVQKHPDELACVIGKPCVLDKIAWRNPILFGAAGHSHPCEDPNLLTRLPIKKVLVPGEWMRQMWMPYYGDVVAAWPVGIDTEYWTPFPAKQKQFDILLYDKVRWDHDHFEQTLIQPIRDELDNWRLSFIEIRYGFYREEDLFRSLQLCRGMIFLCEHETQGIAYQQTLASGVPILAWDRGGICRDPYLLGRGVNFGPVSSVPYWNVRCGIKFPDLASFHERFEEFWEGVQRGRFSPRNYILENLTLENCARRYVELAQQAAVL